MIDNVIATSSVSAQYNCNGKQQNTTTMLSWTKALERAFERLLQAPCYVAWSNLDYVKLYDVLGACEFRGHLGLRKSSISWIYSAANGYQICRWNPKPRTRISLDPPPCSVPIVIVSSKIIRQSAE